MATIPQIPEFGCQHYQLRPGAPPRLIAIRHRFNPDHGETPEAFIERINRIAEARGYLANGNQPQVEVHYRQNRAQYAELIHYPP